jgi:hypothetical protein
MICPIVRYVEHHLIEDYLRAGWLWLAPVSRWACLMGWLCDCKPGAPDSEEEACLTASPSR